MEQFDERFIRNSGTLQLPRSMPPPAAAFRREGPAADPAKTRELEEEVYRRLTKKRQRQLRVIDRRRKRAERQAAKEARRLEGRGRIPAELRLLLGGNVAFAEIARKAGMPVSTVSVILRGLRKPSVHRFVKLVEVLGVSASELYGYLQWTWANPIHPCKVSRSVQQYRLQAAEELIRRACRALQEDDPAPDPLPEPIEQPAAQDDGWHAEEAVATEAEEQAA